MTLKKDREAKKANKALREWSRRVFCGGGRKGQSRGKRRARKLGYNW